MFHFRPGFLFAVACAGFIGGVGSASWDIYWWISLCIGFGILGVWCVKDPGVRKGLTNFYLPSVFFLGFFALGSWRYADVQPTIYSIFAVADGKVHDISGTIVRKDDAEQSTKFTLAQVYVDGTLREDRVLVNAPLFTSALVGERVSVTCSLERPEPFEDFSYERYLAAKDIVATCSSRSAPFILGQDSRVWIRFLATIARVHHGAVQSIDIVFPDPHAQLLAGLLLGDDAFSHVWKERFLRTGTSHIVAASGSNVSLVVSLVLGMLFSMGIRRRYASFVAWGGIGVFVLLAGGESAVLRAGIMASLLVLARSLGRASSMRNVLLCTVCVMVFVEPRILRDDIGFQLSVFSTIGLVFFASRFAKSMEYIPKTLGLREGFATTLAATLATVPVTVFSMGNISLVGPLANLFILPLLPFAMAFGAGATILGMVWPVAGRILAFPAWWILDTVLMMLRELSALSFVHADVSFTSAVFLLVVCLSGYGVWRVWCAKNKKNKRHFDKHTHISFIVPILFCALFLLALGVHIFRDGWFAPSVRVWVFDVGQGDGIFIDTPEKDVVIDGGPSVVMREKLGSVLPWFERDIAYVFATHPHADHIVGLVPVLEHYTVAHVGQSGQRCTSYECFALSLRVPLVQGVQQGDVFSLAPGVTLTALWPEDIAFAKKLSDPNEGSLVFLLNTPYGSMLFTGDAGVEEEQEFLESMTEQVTVLKVGHHGSRTSTSDDLLTMLRPKFSIISLGEDNSFAHPHREVLDRLEAHGGAIYRTDLLGDIRIEFSAQGVAVSGERL